MKQAFVYLCLLGCFLLTKTVLASEFELDGDYWLGGLFDIHHVSEKLYHDRPETITCSSKPFILSSYRRFQLMRFSVEEINNSTSLLPNVTLGYKILDLCSDAQNFPGIFSLIFANGSIRPWDESLRKLSKMIAVVGTYTSTATLSVAPLFMMDHIPMVSYGAASSVFSRKQKFPSFLRTVHPNKDVIEVVLKILQEFDWRWVAFLYIEDDYGRDGQDLFIKEIESTDICLAYTKGLDPSTNYPQMFRQLKSLTVNVYIVFAPEWTAEALIKAAINQNVTNKVWIAGDAWSLHKQLPKEKGIRNIGTVIGIAEPVLPIPGFQDFISAFKGHSCNQNCNCSDVTADDIINADPSFSFPVYSSVYAIAHALHAVLQCGAGKCNNSTKVYPHMVLTELQKSKFPLLNQTVQFDENGDPMFGSYSIVFWNQSGEAEKVGFYNYYPFFQFSINTSKIKWHKDEEIVPVSLCSQECSNGSKKVQEGIHKCCFKCVPCPKGTYINSTGNQYKCTNCNDTQWSATGSTSCKQRLVEYIRFKHGGAIAVMVWTLVFVGLNVAISILFAINYNTPVVKSAGGPMCFLILACLSLCSLSVFFSFGKPTTASCTLRLLPILLFFTVCLACFLVRSFQIVSIFKIAMTFPNFFNWWKKYHGQWLVITVVFVTQVILIIIGYSISPPKVQNKLHEDKILIACEFNIKAASGPLVLFSSLCFLSFCFSYVGKDLPKNYNEAKAITFCLLILILIWITFYMIHQLYQSEFIQVMLAVAVLSSLYTFLFWYFLPKCYIIIVQHNKNTQQYFQSLIHSYATTGNN
uniref:G-protein coupled receptors family 3 profile domain-containing protein n=1 Tax=Kryptolebias marmoratus TaxID=37003 RepID=A0A3Q3AN55_KRYMA